MVQARAAELEIDGLETAMLRLAVAHEIARGEQRAADDVRATALRESEAGIARCSLHMGDLRRGKQLCYNRNDPALFRECALILEGLNQLLEAGQVSTPPRRAAPNG